MEAAAAFCVISVIMSAAAVLAFMFVQVTEKVGVALLFSVALCGVVSMCAVLHVELSNLGSDNGTGFYLLVTAWLLALFASVFLFLKHGPIAFGDPRASPTTGV